MDDLSHVRYFCTTCKTKNQVAQGVKMREVMTGKRKNQPRYIAEGRCPKCGATMTRLVKQTIFNQWKAIHPSG